MTDTLPAEAIEAAAKALWGELPAGYVSDQYRRQARVALLAALPHIRGAEDHYFAVDYTGCIHEAPDKETAIKWAEDFARTANGGAIGSERRDVAAMLADAEARVAPSPTSVPDGQEAVEPFGWAWAWASSDDWRLFGMGCSEAARAEFIRDQEKIAPIKITPLYLHPAPSDMEGVAEANEDQIKHIMLIRLTHTNAKTY